MSKAAKTAKFWGYGIGGLAGQKLVSKGAKGANVVCVVLAPLGAKLPPLLKSWHPDALILAPLRTLFGTLTTQSGTLQNEKGRPCTKRKPAITGQSTTYQPLPPASRSEDHPSLPRI